MYYFIIASECNRYNLVLFGGRNNLCDSFLYKENAENLMFSQPAKSRRMIIYAQNLEIKVNVLGSLYIIIQLYTKLKAWRYSITSAQGAVRLRYDVIIDAAGSWMQFSIICCCLLSYSAVMKNLHVDVLI